MVDTLQKPDVTVTQEFGPQSPSLIRPLLEACLVGPCFQIETKKLAGSYFGALVTFQYPGKKTGAVVSVADVEVFLQQGTDEFDVTDQLPGGSILVSGVTFPATFAPTKTVRTQTQVSTVAGSTFEDESADFVAAGIRPGDVLSFITNALDLIELDSVVSTQAGSFIVLNVLSATELEVTPVLIDENKVEYKIERTGTQTGDVLITYKARRIDGVDVFFEHQTLEDAVAELGPAVPENPLAYAVSIALQHTDSVVSSTMVGGDTANDYSDALEFLESKDVYGMVPLTQDPAVHQAFQQHVRQLSEPIRKRERIALISAEQAAKTIYQEESTTGETGAASDLFNDANAKFITNGVQVGSLLVFDAPQGYDGDPVDSIPIKAIISETQVQTSVNADGTTVGITYTVESRPYTKFQKALNLQNLGKAYNDRRVTQVQPDIAVVSLGSENADVPGHFLAAAIAGLISGSSPSQGFTNFPFAGFVGLKNSNLTYSEEQLSIIAAGGIFMFIQETPGAPVTPRHQLTTAVGAVETRELSIVKTVDFVAKVIRSRIRHLIGINNITDSFLNNVLRPQTNGIIEDLVSDRIIGRNTKITRLEQSAAQPDTVEVDIQLEILYPVNFINYTLFI